MSELALISFSSCPWHPPALLTPCVCLSVCASVSLLHPVFYDRYCSILDLRLFWSNSWMVSFPLILISTDERYASLPAPPSATLKTTQEQRFCTSQSFPTAPSTGLFMWASDKWIFVEWIWMKLSLKSTKWKSLFGFKYFLNKNLEV